MTRTKATAIRLIQPIFVPAPGQRIGNKSMNRGHVMFKIKALLHKLKLKKWPSYKENERQEKIPLFLW